MQLRLAEVKRQLGPNENDPSKVSIDRRHEIYFFKKQLKVDDDKQAW